MVNKNNEISALKNKINKLMSIEELYAEKFMSLIVYNHMTLESLIQISFIDSNFTKVNQIKRLSKDEIMDNPYLKNIKANNKTYGNIRFSKSRVIPSETISVYDEKYRDLETFQSHSKYFYCDEILILPGLVDLRNNSSWMTVEPLEINSFNSFLESAHGDVLLIGCGLGYVAYMLSLKENVDSITIVDNDQDVIKSFKKLILPQFKNKGKINIIHDDGINYLKNNDLSKYTCVNVDIWHDTADMVDLYLPCLEIEKNYPQVEFSYWLENNLKNDLQASILKHFAEMKVKHPTFERIAKDILDNVEIKCEDDLRELIKLDDMREVLYNWYINNQELFKPIDTKKYILTDSKK